MLNYTRLDILLHDIFLGKKLILKSVYEIEKLFFLKKKDYHKNKHVFITGLPRSGTTALLNFLDKFEELCSLKYKNMPLILSPNLSKMFNKNKWRSQERFHKDKIFIDLESPESFDEVFFKNFSKEEIEIELLNFLNLFLNSNNSYRYLSKNNLNYKRIDLILKILPNSLFLIPIRNPIQHAYSLLNQHYNFKKLHSLNNFSKRYMKYLGHEEFGDIHKYWNHPQNFKDTNSLNYWLEQWKFFYLDIYNNYKDKKNCKFIIYENLQNPDYIKKIENFLNLKNTTSNIFELSKKKAIENYDEDLFHQTDLIYSKFLEMT